jgi:diguanylate cyclase (GGDEF)-like protein
LTGSAGAGATPGLSGPHALRPLSGEFRDAATERSFLAAHLPTSQAQLRLTMLASAFFYVLFSLADFDRLGSVPDAWLLMAGRGLMGVLAALGVLAIRHGPQSSRMLRQVATVFEVIGLAVFMLIAVKRPVEMQWHAMALVIVLIALYIYIPNRLIYTVAMGLPASAVFVWCAAAAGTVDYNGLLTIGALLLVANLFGAGAARRYQRLAREEYSTQQVLKNRAVRDPMTGCYNRRYLHEQLLENEIVRARRYGLSLSVIMCDLDHFKKINDTYGHAGGDLVLCTFASLLMDTTRQLIDTVVRYGGEEFLLVLPETDLSGAVLVAERLRTAFAGNTIVDPMERRINGTASFGVVAIDFADEKKSITQYEMIASADELLYSAKNNGRNRVHALLLQ